MPASINGASVLWFLAMLGLVRSSRSSGHLLLSAHLHLSSASHRIALPSSLITTLSLPLTSHHASFFIHPSFPKSKPPFLFPSMSFLRSPFSAGGLNIGSDYHHLMYTDFPGFPGLRDPVAGRSLFSEKVLDFPVFSPCFPRGSAVFQVIGVFRYTSAVVAVGGVIVVNLWLCFNCFSLGFVLLWLLVCLCGLDGSWAPIKRGSWYFAA